jgi:formimidoylglutamate deiminase
LIHADRALLPQGWAENVLVEIGPDGAITAVSPGRAMPAGAERAGLLLPGIPNVHSHAFQRAMAGLAERLPEGEASFWTWRAVMYAFAGRMTPDIVRAVATQLYVEMLEAGYTAVGEFHYLHHQPDGQPHADPAELALAHLDAARRAGIGITMLPSLYVTGGFGQPAEAGQRRFLHDLDEYLRLVERLRRETAGRADEGLGIAPHSLRAVPPEVLVDAVGAWRALAPDGPVHLHLAEQVREVRECLEATGRRPGERLLELVRPDPGWTLIHATHLADDELAALAATGAVAGLCPSTEGNLGDGLFRLADWLTAGGRLAIGTDSQVVIDPFEELRWLEHGQRTQVLRRTVAASPERPHTGARLLTAVLAGGRQALGRPIGRIEPGARADLLVLDADHPRLVERAGDGLLDSLVLAPGKGMVRHVMVGGRWQVRDGRHHGHDDAASAYRQAVRGLVP